jgi:Domain of unknown function (DUF4272)
MTAQERKNKTEQFLIGLQIPINPILPVIEEENEVQIRSSKEIAKRILVLTYLGVYVDSETKEEKTEIINFLKTEGLWEAVSEFEMKLFAKNKLTKKDKINISWRTECIYILLWTIQKIKTIDLPIEQCDTEQIFNILPEYLEPLKEFVQNATLRPLPEILDKSDLIYRLHWATREADSNEEDIPGNIDPGIIQEWHYTMNWLTYYDDNWDDILTDT